MVDRTMPAERDLLTTTAQLFGVVFLLVGILGFIPGITSDAPGDFSGDGSEAELLGIFKREHPAQHRAPALRHRRPGARAHSPKVLERFSSAAGSSTCCCGSSA